MTTSSKELPRLPLDHNMEDINLASSTTPSSGPSSLIAVNPPGPYARALSKQSHPVLATKESLPIDSASSNRIASVASTHTPSPLKNQIPVSRSSSVKSSSSSSSSNPTSVKSATSQYIVQVEKTPQNLTPSQRLNLRKAQMNNSISRFKTTEQPTKTVSQPNMPYSSHLSVPPNPKMSTIDSEDEEIDDHEYVFNVPISQSLASINQREKFTFGNSDRKSSMTNTDSTRASSILSHGSSMDMESTFTSYEDLSFNASKPSLNIEELRLSKDAHELTLLFNQSDFIQIYEESRQRKKLLNTFTKLNVSTPALPAEDPSNPPYLQSEQKVASSPKILQSQLPKIRSVSSPSLPTSAASRPVHSRFISNPSLPVTPPPPQTSIPESSSFSKYYSFTRPTWLPPKSTYDKRKHHKESEDMIYQALIKESKEQSRKMYQLERIRKLKVNDMKTWYQLLDTDNHKEFQKKIEKSDSIWWRGISPEVRSQIWWKQFGGTNKFSDTFCTHFFSNVDDKILPKINLLEGLLLESRKIKFSLDQYKKSADSKSCQSFYKKTSDLDERIAETMNIEVMNNLKLSSVKLLYDKITNDLLDVFPDLNFFQNYEVIQNLTRIILCLVFYLYESAPGYQDQNLSKFYFSGINNLVAVFYYNYKNIYKSLISICQFYNHHLPSLLMNYRMLSSTSKDTSTEHTIVMNSLHDFFVDRFEASFFKTLNSLFTHFKVIGISTLEYLPSLVLGLLSNVLNFQVSNHLIDVYIFEKDEFLIKLILGLFKTVQHKLFGNKEEVLAVLGVSCITPMASSVPSSAETRHDIVKYLNVGSEYEFVETIKNIQL